MNAKKKPDRGTREEALLKAELLQTQLTARRIPHSHQLTSVVMLDAGQRSMAVRALPSGLPSLDAPRSRSVKSRSQCGATLQYQNPTETLCGDSRWSRALQPARAASGAGKAQAQQPVAEKDFAQRQYAKMATSFLKHQRVQMKISQLTIHSRELDKACTLMQKQRDANALGSPGRHRPSALCVPAQIRHLFDLPSDDWRDRPGIAFL